MFDHLSLTPMRLPAGAPRRDSVLKSDAQASDFELKYDFHTLVYDAIDTGGHVVLVCPKLRNLERLFLNGRFEDGDGAALSFVRLRRYRRHDEVWLKSAGALDRLRWQGAQGLDLSMPVSAVDRRLDGLRVVSTKSFNNDLQWIADWADHHVRHQGAEAVLLFDNGSTDYAVADVREALRGVEALRAALVVDTPLRFGPMGVKSPMGKALFLQCGLLNITRHRFVAGARSHLHCDVDELAVSDPGTLSLFAQAERSFWGYATAACLWRYAPGPGKKRHRDHVWRTEPDTGTKEKWAVVPSGRLSGIAWDCHGVGRYQLNGWCKSRGTRFLHCAQISIGWKGSSRQVEGGDLVEDEMARAVFAGTP